MNERRLPLAKVLPNLLSTFIKHCAQGHLLALTQKRHSYIEVALNASLSAVTIFALHTLHTFVVCKLYVNYVILEYKFAKM
jgi:hypothetical protein